MHPVIVRLALLTPFSALACSGGDPAPAETDRVVIEVAALSFDDVADAEYRVTVTNALPSPNNVVWTKTLRATQYGNGSGSLSYVGPCDASASPNTVTLELLGLYEIGGQPIPATSYVPPPAIARTVACAPNTDTPVSFELTVMREASQGFFDVAVEFDDIFCSAKLDCQDALLNLPGGARGPTEVVAFACTTGQRSGAAEPLFLYMDDLRIECTDYSSGSPVVQPALRVPVGAAYDGNQGLIAPLVHQYALYRGQEELAGYSKCFWNTAIGLDPAMLASNKLACRVVGKATASPSDWRPGNSGGLGAIRPTVTWDVPLTTQSGGVVSNACSGASARHALNVTGSGVATAYAPPGAPAAFDAAYPCDPNGAAPPPVRACSGDTATFGSDATATQDGSVMLLTIGAGPAAQIRLPVGATVDGCCANGCCQ